MQIAIGIAAAETGVDLGEIFRGYICAKLFTTAVLTRLESSPVAERNVVEKSPF